jgi:hypothetical protein
MFKISTLDRLDSEERACKLDSFASGSDPTADAERTIRELQAKIQRLESKYGMSSKAMKQKLAEGDIQETAEIAKWKFLLNAITPTRTHAQT